MATTRPDAFQVIADPSRRQILHMLTAEPLTINAIAENFDMSRPAVSKHIRILCEAGFISIEDVGRERYCIIKQDGFNELKEWLSYYNIFWAGKLKALDSLIARKKAKDKKNI